MLTKPSEALLLAVTLVVGGCSTTTAVPSGNTSPPPADAAPRPDGCPQAFLGGAACGELNKICRYEDTCPRAVTVAICEKRFAQRGPIWNILKEEDCLDAGPLNPDGCPVMLADGLRCTEAGKVCYDDHNCPAFARGTFTCAPRGDAGALYWNAREDKCP